MPKRTLFSTFEFSVIVCRNTFRDSSDYGKWLAVDENKNRGWWLPAGAVDAGESFAVGALRECKEEAGIDVTLRGVIKIDHSVHGRDGARMRVVFYAEPVSLEQADALKSVPDEESNGARWVTIEELEEMRSQGMLRGKELLDFASYLERGGQIFPLALFGEEGSVPNPECDTAFQLDDNDASPNKKVRSGAAAAGPPRPGRGGVCGGCFGTLVAR